MSKYPHVERCFPKLPEAYTLLAAALEDWGSASVVEKQRLYERSGINPEQFNAALKDETSSLHRLYTDPDNGLGIEAERIPRTSLQSILLHDITTSRVTFMILLEILDATISGQAIRPASHDFFPKNIQSLTDQLIQDVDRSIGFLETLRDDESMAYIFDDKSKMQVDEGRLEKRQLFVQEHGALPEETALSPYESLLLVRKSLEILAERNDLLMASDVNAETRAADFATHISSCAG